MDANDLLFQIEQAATEQAAADDAARYRAVALSLLAELAAGPGDEWRRHAACKNADVELFHRRSSENAATAICARCPVRDECLQSVMDLPADLDGAGVYGGMTASERKALRRSTAA